VMWGIEALKESYAVTLITTGNVDLDKLNRFYGTAVRSNEISIQTAPLPNFLLNFSWGDALRGALYQRFCQNFANEFDVLISAYNMCYFGVPAIHCIADFSWDEQTRLNFHPIPAGLRGLFHRFNFFRNAYSGVVKVLSRSSGRNLFAGEDFILANSQWTSGIIKEKYGIDVEVLYPPVVTNFLKVPQEEKKLGFVCIGRISPEKRIEQIIDILGGIRGRGHDIHLHVIGEINNDPYGKKIRQLCYNHREWIIAEDNCFGKKKLSLLTEHKFGIHACQGEAFGIGVAEMVKAGCIVFAPSEGGQAEIINHQSLLYDNIEDAIDKIDTVLRDPEVQTDLRNHLRKPGKNFSTSEFMNGLRSAVENFLEKKSTLRKAA